MKQVNMHQAKSQLSKLVEAAVVRLMPVQTRKRRTLGAFKGKIWMSEDFNTWPDDLARALGMID
jgi:antitoxin (DNA-binding transcriptional repressor) of toxin-antitoxin stability system